MNEYNSKMKEAIVNKINRKIELELHQEVTSTNAILLDRIKREILPEAYTIIANAQTAGVGRYGRTFHSPQNTGVYMSVLLKPQHVSKDTINMITVAAAVATAQAVESISDQEAKIKWVNDIFVNDKKVAGILAQGQVDNKTGVIDQIVLGIGVNLYKPKGGFHEDIKETAGSVIEECRKEERAEIMERYITTLLNTFFTAYSKLEEKAYVQEYISRSMLIGRVVGILENGQEKTARVLEIDSDCNLVVEYEHGEIMALESGELSIKL